MIPVVTLRSFSKEAAGLEKIALDRATKEIRKLWEAGKEDEARALAERFGKAGILKETPAGTQLTRRLETTGPDQDKVLRLAKHVQANPRDVAAGKRLQELRLQKASGGSVLGGGAEGLASRVIGPEGIQVRKHFYPEGQGPLASDKLQERKAQLFRAAKDNPNVADIYGEGRAGLGGEYIHRMEEVVGDKVSREKMLSDIDDPYSQRHQVESQLAALHRRQGGAGVADVAGNTGNMIWTDRHGWKAIDVLPTERDPQGSFQHVLAAEGAGNVPIIPELREYFPRGVNPKFLERPELGGHIPPSPLEMAKRLGAGSRQEKKVRGAKETAQNIFGTAEERVQRGMPHVFSEDKQRLAKKLEEAHTAVAPPPSSAIPHPSSAAIPHSPAAAASSEALHEVGPLSRFLTPKRVGLGLAGLGATAATGYGLKKYLDNRKQQQQA